MSSAPRSPGTQSVSAFREELNKLLPPELTDDEVRNRIVALLVQGESMPVSEVARRIECSPQDVLRALRLPEGTSHEQAVRIRVEAEGPATKRPTRPARK